MILNDIEDVIQRVLGLKKGEIVNWRFESSGASMGLIKNSLYLSLRMPVERLYHFRDQNVNRRGSILVADMSVSHSHEPSYVDTVGVSALLLYGRETQQIFAALAKTMQYKKPKKIRRK